MGQSRGRNFFATHGAAGSCSAMITFSERTLWAKTGSVAHFDLEGTSENRGSETQWLTDPKNSPKCKFATETSNLHTMKEPLSCKQSIISRQGVHGELSLS